MILRRKNITALRGEKTDACYDFHKVQYWNAELYQSDDFQAKAMK